MSTINELKEKLMVAGASVAAPILSQIESIKSTAEEQIRTHQKDVDFQTKEYTVELIVQKYSVGIESDKNELFIPDYQRDFTWPEKFKSKLIESLLIGLPIPYIFIADVASDDPEYDGRTEIVDGSQRIRTLHAFLTNQLILTELKLLTQLNGFRFEDLPPSRQRRFNRIPIRIIELSQQCNEDTRRDLFERINTGSDVLKAMEIRKGSDLGNTPLYKQVIKPCSELALFKTLAPMSLSKEKRDERLEFTLRFFAYLENYQNFQHSVREFLDDYMRNHSDKDDANIHRMNEEFQKVLEFAHNNFPNGFRKTENAKETYRVRFEAIAVGTALALREKPNLVPNNMAWLDSNEFKKHTTSDASNSKPKVIARIEYVRDKLLGN
ncbi:MAG: DUF262 domain-containing protein [Methylomonas lenta]|nr:DUF262 domain-containing protein [Methylomonas lenta]